MLSTEAEKSAFPNATTRSEEHTSELQSRLHLVCRLLLEKKKNSSDAIGASHLGPPSAPFPPTTRVHAATVRPPCTHPSVTHRRSFRGLPPPRASHVIHYR